MIATSFTPTEKTFTWEKDETFLLLYKEMNDQEVAFLYKSKT